MDLGLAGKTVIVTGGASNIGRAISLTFAREGASVAIADLDQEKATETAAEATQQGARSTLALSGDLTKPDEVRAVVAAVEEQFGQVDVLINNVGGWTPERLFVEKTTEEWEWEIRINLWSMILCTRSVLDGMIQRQSGSIVSIGSDAGRVGEFRAGVYSAVKAGVIALSKSLAREYGRYNIRFNVVCPGTTIPESTEETSAYSLWRQQEHQDWNTPEMRERIAKAYPLRRLGTPDDIAKAAAFLGSDAANFITGQTLSVSGGYSMI